MDAKQYTNEVLGTCYLDRYDSCGRHQSMFNQGVQCDRWLDYYYACASILEAYKDELYKTVEALKKAIPLDFPIWMTTRAAMITAYNDVLDLLPPDLTYATEPATMYP